MTPAEEAAAILIRMFETLAYSMNKRLKEEHRVELRRACELLSMDGALPELEDAPTMPRMRPAAEDADALPEHAARIRRERAEARRER